MICTVCGGELREYDEYYRCSNSKCKIKRNKCITKDFKRQSLNRTPQPRYTKEETDAIIGVTAVSIVIIAGLLISIYFVIQAAATVV